LIALLINTVNRHIEKAAMKAQRATQRNITAAADRVKAFWINVVNASIVPIAFNVEQKIL
jgi:hypothetical protein